jgi:uncharacterized repeat protein (TIGR01451 family)
MKTRRFFVKAVASLFLFAPEILQASQGGGGGTNTDLAIGKTASTNAVTVGQVLSFQLSVTNLGPLTATSATVEDLLPSGLMYLSSSGPGTYNPATGQWIFSPGAVGGVSFLTITVQATNAGFWLNSAYINSSTPPDTNSANNTASASVSVYPPYPPIVLTCSSNLTVNASSSSGAIVFFNVPASGGCSTPNVNAMPPSGSQFPIGTTTVYTTASDGCGNTTNCSFTVTVVSPPIVLNCSSNLTVNATSSSGATVFFTVTTGGGCSPPVFNAMPPSGSQFAIGTTMVYTTASDGCGNSTNCSFTVTVVRPPIVLNCSTNLSVTATSSNGVVVFFNVPASGGCSQPMVNAMPPSGSTFPVGMTTVYTTATDTCGNTTNCSFTVTVYPPVYPPIVLTCSSNLTVNATSSSGATVFFNNATATGGCSQPVVSAMPPSGSQFPIGMTTVYTTATDTCGNTTNCSFTVTVVRPPIVLNCSTNLSVTATSPSGAVVFFTVTASGGCSQPVVNAMPSSGSTFAIGTTTVYTTATDTCGNTTNCSFTVTVYPPVYPPIVLTCSSNLAVTATSPSGAVVFFTVTASGGCSQPFVNAMPPSGSQFPVGMTTVYTTATDTCGNTTNCSFTVTVNAPQADLAVTKTVATNSIFVGGLANFTITVTNLGPDTSSNITVTDVLPPGLAYSSSGSPGGTSFNSAIGAWIIPVLAVGNGYALALTARGTNAGTFTNTATLTGSTPADTNAANNSASAVVTVQLPPADLQITKTANPTNAFPGQQVVFTVSLQNLGPNNITNAIVVTDCLPPGFEYVTDSTYGGGGIGTYSPGTCWWTLTGLGVNATVYLTITAATTNLGTFTNTATVAVPQGYSDPNLTNNSASAVVVVSQPAADLAVTKTVSTNTAKLFQGFNFYVAITNVGPTAVSNVFVTDLLPAGLTEVFWVGYGGINQNYNPTNGVWSITNIPPGQAYSLTIGSAGAATGTFTNVAQLMASTPADTNAANNTASAVVTITPLQADLAVTKTVSPGVMNTNGQVQFTVTIQNNGPDTATNIIVQDNLPAGLVLISSNIPAGTLFNSGTGSWSIPFLTNGATAVLGMTVTTANAGNFTNVAFVASSGSTDPNPLNNTNRATVIFVASPSADLGVLLIPTTNSAPVGGTILFECIVTNLGPNSPTNVAARLTYPPGMTISGVFGPFSFGTFDTNTGILQVSGALTPGTYEQVNVQFTLTNAGVFTLNFQTTSSSLPDPIPANNSASVTVTGLVSYAISGGIFSCSGAALTNLPVVLSAANMANVTTNTGTNGSFTFSSLLPGAYNVAPAGSNYFFMPTNMAVTIVNTNVTLTNFIALPRFITGTVLQGGTNGQPVAGVTMLLGGALSLTNTTDTNGVYIFTNLNAGTYTVTPQTNGFFGIQFAPTNATVSLGSPTNCPGAANFITTNIIVVLRALEVIQVVQDWSNSVVLVANKTTLVRAHLQLYGTNTAPILVENARLYAQNAGGSTSWPPDNGRITVLTNNCAAPVIRSNIAMSLNFTVRNGYNTGLDTFRFSWTNGIVFNTEPADVSGDPASNGQVRVSFNVMPPLGVRFVRVAMINGFMTNITALATNIVAITNLPTPAQIDEQIRRLISIYPITQVTNLAYGYYFWRSPMNASYSNELVLLQGINAARLTSSDTNGIATNRIWYGVAPQGVNMRGLGYVPGGAAEGCISVSAQDVQRHLAAHEIGHALGRPHSILAAFGAGTCGAGNVTGHCGECAPAGTPDFPMVNVPGLGPMPTLGLLTGDNQVIWGYDTYQNLVISPYFYYDLMSYCYGYANTGPWPWNSKFTYTNLYSAIQTRFGAVPPPVYQGLPEPGQSPSSPYPYLLVRGQIDDDSGAATFDPCYPIASALPVNPGPFTLVLLDTNAVPLYSLPFAPDVPEGESGDEPASDTFDLSVPILPGAAAIEIYSNAMPVGELVASTYPLSVQLLYPNGGETLGDTDIVASWYGADKGGNPLVYLVQFSPDGGNSWDTLMIDWDQTNLDIPPDTLPATTNGLIRVIASDGFNTCAAQSAGPFTINDHVPSISILQPGSGALYYGDQTIVLEADAYDLEDGPLDGTNVLWNSSLDGPLGSGATLPLETLNLSQGVHLVTATAIANSGLTSSASVQITVLRQAPPQLSIQLVNEQIQLSWPACYTNYVLETTTNLLPSNWATVTNVPVTTNILQTVNLNLSTTNQYFRLQMPQ